MSEYVAVVEWYWQEKTEELRKKLSQSHFFYQKSWTAMGMNRGLYGEKHYGFFRYAS
jgi:hypothetical protein